MQLTAAFGIRPAAFAAAGARYSFHAASTTSPPKALHHMRQEAGEFAGHQGKVGIELLVGMFGGFLGLFLEQIEEGQTLDFQLFAEDEGNPVIPGQRQLGRQLAAGQVGLDLALISSPSSG
jgi:hypothetical protein